MAFGLARGQLKRHFGSDQSVWRDDDWNGFVRIALAGLLAPLMVVAHHGDVGLRFLLTQSWSEDTQCANLQEGRSFSLSWLGIGKKGYCSTLMDI